MSNDPDVIRAQIEQTRAGLSSDVNELGEKVSPAQIAKRQRDKVKGGVMAVKDHIMGATDTAQNSAGGAMSSVGDAVSNAPGKVAQQTKGSPMAAGLIAFGAGVLLSALIPASKPEAQAAAAIKEQAQPLGRSIDGDCEGSRRESAGAGAAGVGVGEVHGIGRGRHGQGRRKLGRRRRQGSSPGRERYVAAASIRQLNRSTVSNTARAGPALPVPPLAFTPQLGDE